jgi:hypothetical protein
LIFAIDHIVFAATARQRAELIATLQGCGFPPVDFHLDFPDIGGASDSVGMRGGSSLEFVYPTPGPGQPGSSPSGTGQDAWFAEVPRVIGLGFASDSFDADTDWDGDPGAWTMPAQQGFPNSAGPHEHHSDFYVFVMNRKDGVLQFPELAKAPAAPATPRLARITLTGQAAGQWRGRLSRWLRLPAAGDGLAAGSTELAFADGPGPSVRATLTFEVTGSPAVLPLAAGELRLVREPAP